MGAVDGEFPFAAEITLAALLGALGNQRNEQRARLDLRADFGVPGVAAAQLILVKPDLDAERAQGLGDMARGLGVLAGVGKKDRFGGFAHVRQL